MHSAMLSTCGLKPIFGLFENGRFTQVLLYIVFDLPCTSDEEKMYKSVNILQKWFVSLLVLRKNMVFKYTGVGGWEHTLSIAQSKP